MINLNGTNFDDGTKIIHGTILAPMYGLDEHVQTFWGLSGAAALYSRQTSRVLTLRATFHNFANEGALRTFVANLRSACGVLNGTLNVDGVLWPNSMLISVEYQEPFRDGANYHGWCAVGEFQFRQLNL